MQKKRDRIKEIEKKKEKEDVMSTVASDTTTHDAQAQLLDDIEQGKAATVAKQITYPPTSEIREAAYSELYKLSSRTRLLKHKSIWDILGFLLTQQNSSNLRDGLSILENMIKAAEQQSERQQVFQRVKELYPNRLKDILRYTDSVFTIHRQMVIEIFKRIMSAQELFSACWDSFRDGIRDISDEHNYEEYLKPILNPLEYSNAKYKELIRDELLQYMKDSSPRKRKRALDIYKMFFIS